MSKKITDLKSGTDIRGYAIETNGQIDLNKENVNKIGQGIIEWYKQKYNKPLKKVAIGRDSRITGPDLLDTLAKTFVANDIYVIDTGLSTSPSMFMITKEEDIAPDLAIMITASHMPMEWNGIKIVTNEGGLTSNDISEILENASKKEVINLEEKANEEYNYIPRYANRLVETIRSKTGEDKPLEGLKIVVDAGNGAGGFYADYVLNALGADTEGSRFLEPDGTFPNHVPNPEEKEAIQSIQEAVLDNKANMGIIFDTDVDRSAIIDEKGNPINKSAFIAFISSLLLSENPGATIVTDSVTSKGLADYIQRHGGKHHRFKRGYKNVIDEAKRLNDLGENAVLAMETSGHGAVKDNYFLDDGAYLAVLSLIALAKANANGQPVSEYLSDYHYPEEEKEIRYTITVPDFQKYGDKLLEDFKNFVISQPGWTLVEPNYEGVRADVDEEYGNGWILVRKSLHEPKIPINIESDKTGGAEEIAQKLYEFISDYKDLK